MILRRPRINRERPQYHLPTSFHLEASEEGFKILCASKIVAKHMAYDGICVGGSPGMNRKTPSST